jgi:alpha-beta hydrolase superfamily lysophospholipase
VARHPDLNLLSIAFALYDELSFSRAAKVLGVSQPAVSKALRRRLEPSSLSAIRNMPVIVVQGEADTAVPVDNTRRWIDTIKKLG